MHQQTYLTPEGAAKLQAELTELTGPRREELSRRLRSAIQIKGCLFSWYGRACDLFDWWEIWYS